MDTIVVFSHLRWDFVHQRPQHLLSWLARRYQVLFIVEPVLDERGPVRLERSGPAPGVTVCQPRTPLHASGHHDNQIALVLPLLATLMAAPPARPANPVAPTAADMRPIAWFYTPMALPLLQAFEPRLVVYDCMDELASFAHAPKQLLQRESALLNLADLVFAGGPSLYEAKRTRHPHVHCFPSSVDAAHFRQAQDRAAVHPALASIPHPRLGFYGVIDERIDLALVAAVADARPGWQIVLAGPVVKLPADALPRRPNIHYLGQQPYEALPRLLAGWDLCLMPFALNEATRFISPTKVLEYMAAELPIVSMPIADVAGPYGNVVSIANGAGAFIDACAATLAQDAPQRAVLAQAMRAQVACTSWERTADAMAALLAAAPVRPAHSPPATASDPAPAAVRAPTRAPTRAPVSAVGHG